MQTIVVTMIENHPIVQCISFILYSALFGIKTTSGGDRPARSAWAYSRAPNETDMRPQTPLEPPRRPLGAPRTAVCSPCVCAATGPPRTSRRVLASGRCGGASPLRARYRCDYRSAGRWAGRQRGPGASKWHYFGSERPPGERSDSTYQQLEKLTLTPRHQHTHNQLHWR